MVTSFIFMLYQSANQLGLKATFPKTSNNLMDKIVLLQSQNVISVSYCDFSICSTKCTAFNTGVILSALARLSGLLESQPTVALQASFHNDARFSAKGGM